MIRAVSLNDMGLDRQEDDRIRRVSLDDMGLDRREDDQTLMVWEGITRGSQVYAKSLPVHTGLFMFFCSAKNPTFSWCWASVAFNGEARRIQLIFSYMLLGFVRVDDKKRYQNLSSSWYDSNGMATGQGDGERSGSLEYGRCFKRSTCTYEYKSLTRRLSVQEGSDCNGKGAIIQYNVMTFQNNI